MPQQIDGGVDITDRSSTKRATEKDLRSDRISPPPLPHQPMPLRSDGLTCAAMGVACFAVYGLRRGGEFAPHDHLRRV
jgi:hypothetical protein